LTWQASSLVDSGHFQPQLGWKRRVRIFGLSLERTLMSGRPLRIAAMLMNLLVSEVFILPTALTILAGWILGPFSATVQDDPSVQILRYIISSVEEKFLCDPPHFPRLHRLSIRQRHFG
jgi:hypothetical protein